VNQGVFSGGTGPAYKSWRVDGEPGPLRLVRAAILGASPHNTQPWLFRVREASIDVWADTRRHIGTIDPYLREMYVGVGCALENLLIAAAREGYAAVLTLMPDAADPAHAAHVALIPAAPAESALYAAIPRRHTNRGPYDTARAVPSETLSAMAQLGPDLPDVKVFWFDRGPDRKRIGDAIVSATEAIIADRQQSQDSARWFRASRQDLERHRDGITLDAQGLPPVVNALAKMLPAVSSERADAAWLEATRDRHVATAAAFWHPGRSRYPRRSDASPRGPDVAADAPLGHDAGTGHAAAQPAGGAGRQGASTRADTDLYNRAGEAHRRVRPGDSHAFSDRLPGSRCGIEPEAGRRGGAGSGSLKFSKH
jgi:hypothetical protein